ncbi:MAG: hypothetical protein IT319_00870 [Anaerolineae bacterium]|nr:hypothetical protein [Anaerolineae bacterium]
MMNERWTKRGAVSAGGTVFSGAVDQQGRVLAASPAGIFRRVGESWAPLPNQPAVPFLQSFAYSGGHIFLSGSNLILFSTNNGGTWNRGQAAALDKPVTCLALSPDYSQDRVVLAGTDGAGILRSTDGGRYWQYSSFGLQDFSITALTAVPVWNDREIMFAATAAGLYRSPNGGRAWKLANCGLEDCVVLSIAPSPNFAQDGMVFVGTEADGIFRSCDGGFTWQPGTIASELGAAIPAINVLWFCPDGETCLAGLDDGRILRSWEHGDSWVTDAKVSTSILCFFSEGDRLYAGTADAGILDSADGGRSWRAASDFVAREFTSLFSTANTDLYAFGGTEGLWRSGDQGQSWDNIGDFESLLLTAATADDDNRCRLAGTAQGLFRADDADPDWQLVLPLADVTTIRFSKTFALDHHVWAGTWDGGIFASRDGGHDWQPMKPPPARMPVVALGVFHDQHESEQIISITFNPGTQILTLWRWLDAENKWQVWLESPCAVPAAHIVESNAVSGEIVVGLGGRCWHWISGLWYCILKTDKPILRLLRHPLGGLVALTADSILYSTDFVNWTAVYQSQDDLLNDLALLPDDEERAFAHILTRGGDLVHGTIPE